MTTESELEELRQKVSRRLQKKNDKPPASHLRAVAPDEALPEVTPIGDAAFEDWPSEWLPAPVRDWVDACHLALGVPKVMAIAAALCTAATLAQGKLHVRIRDDWDEPVNLYWIVLAPTGARKSALLKLATEPVRRIQAELDAKVEPEAHDARCRLKRAEAQHSRLIRQVKAHKYTEGYQEHLHQVQELEQELRSITIPKAPRWLCDDVNPTVLPKVLKHNLEAEGIARLAVLDAEGTFLSNLLGRHDKRGTVNVDPLLKAFNGEPVDMIRTSQTTDDLVRVHLPHSYITMCLLVQPLFEERLMNRPELAENGFLGRCLVTKTAPRSKAPDLDAPRIPKRVQEAYSEWCLGFARMPQDSLLDLSTDAGLQEELRALNRTVEAFQLSNEGGDGFLARALGKICRVFALLAVDTDGTIRTVELSRWVGGVAHAHPGVTREGILTYLFKLMITGTYARAKALEPPAGGVTHLCTRVLGALSRRRQFKGSTVRLRDVQNWCQLGREQAQEVCDALAISGHFEQLESKQNRNKTITVTYRIVTLDPMGSARPKPTLVPDPEDDGREPDSMPGADEYLDPEEL